MTPGPNLILKLPVSGTLTKIATLCSGNTFGERFWTDGKRDAPMLPDQPWLRCVSAGGELFWADECTEIASEEPWAEKEEFADIPYAKEPEMADYLRALSIGLADSPEKERYIRTRLWWSFNDAYREDSAPAFIEGEDRANLVRLRELLNEDEPEERLTAAEIHRELGEFAEAARLLKYEFGDDLNPVAKFLRGLTGEGDQNVREIELP